jgi:hypothetical protein
LMPFTATSPCTAGSLAVFYRLVPDTAVSSPRAV